MGILMEADYKGLVSGKESPISGFQKVFAASKDRGFNPMEKKLGEDITASSKNDQFSYEVMNRDTAITLAKHAAEENVGTFCYISAAGGAPVLPHRYIKTKREAENHRIQLPQDEGRLPQASLDVRQLPRYYHGFGSDGWRWCHLQPAHWKIL